MPMPGLSTVDESFKHRLVVVPSSSSIFHVFHVVNVNLMFKKTICLLNDDYALSRKSLSSLYIFLVAQLNESLMQLIEQSFDICIISIS